METHTVRLFGGPLDGMVMANQQLGDDPGAYMIVPGEMHRAIYEPTPGEDPATWHYQGDIG